MSFHAIVPSPLGDILLTADAYSLTGLHFTDQRDCPAVPGMDTTADDISDPSAGMAQGKPIRSFKAVRPDAADEQLPGMDAILAGDMARAATLPASIVSSLRVLQDDTPDDALAVLNRTAQELDEYWCGARQVFDVPLDPPGTDFQKRVWQALLAVRCGSTLSYGQLAEQAGLGAGYGRAVGTAVGSNPISIIIPCHRILASNHTLNGYGGGLGRKVRLLELEGFRVG